MTRQEEAQTPLDFDSWCQLSTQGRLTEKGSALLRAAWEMSSRQENEAIAGRAIANILAALHADAEALSAGMLYPSLQSGEYSLSDVEAQVGAGVAALLAGAQKMDSVNKLQSNTRAQADKLRGMLLAMAKDVRVVLIKLAERVYVLRNSKTLEPGAAKAIAKDSMDIYAPLANRLGIAYIKWELEDLAFRILQPKAYAEIAASLDVRRDDREKFIQKMIAALQTALREANVEGDISGRAKHIFSIWRKMQRKNLPYSEIFDVHALRILVKDVTSCYAALGCVHTLWQHIPKEFDDYIATPKENGYRSLHTAVVGPESGAVEIQIRTHEMHEESELGVAAHWQYKEGGAKQSGETGQKQKVQWLRHLLDWQKNLTEEDDVEALKELQSQAFDDYIYALTPKGEIIDLPQGATPIDFAYHIHSDVGNRCRGAKVKGSIVPLTYALQTGDKVDIMTTKEGGPSRDWLSPHLGYIKTARARAKIHQWFRKQDYKKNIIEGREIVERELSRLALPALDFEKLAPKMNVKTGNDVLAGLGRGDIRFGHVLTAANVLLPEAKPPLQRPKAPRHPGKRTDIVIQGVGNLLTHIADCCKPVPGDTIIGYVTQGKGVSIHQKACPNLLHLMAHHDERILEVAWQASTAQTYPLDIVVYAYDRQGLLNDITRVLANEKVNVTGANTQNQADGIAKMILTLEVNSLAALERVLGGVLQLPNIFEAKRYISGQENQKHG